MGFITISDGYSSDTVNTDQIISMRTEYNTFSKDETIFKLANGSSRKGYGRKEDFMTGDFVTVSDGYSSQAINKRYIVSMKTEYNTFSKDETIIKLSDGTTIKAIGRKEDFS
jgi:hypothetical protein